MKVVSLYKFMDIDDPDSFRDQLKVLCDEQSLLGTILVAREGFNGTIAGNESAINVVLNFIRDRFKLNKELEAFWADSKEAPFRKMRVKVKKEIVSLGRPDVLPHRLSGKHVDVKQWNKLISNPDVLVIDTRNQYEIEVGTFPGAVNPENNSFREFGDFAKKLAEEDTNRQLAMFCTGGIRCEKATALMLELGFSDVYHLKGGILKYLAEVNQSENKWSGECFVFDSRIAVDRDLIEGEYQQCHACRRPLKSSDLESPHYLEGVSCEHCNKN